MPKQTFALEQNGSPRVEIAWGMFWKNVTVKLDGQLLDTIATKKELQTGRDFSLPDGSALEVKLAHKFTTQELQVLRNGQPLPGSDSDPQARVKTASHIGYFIAGLNIGFGLVAILFQVEFLFSLGIGVVNVIEGVIYALLAFLVGRKSLVALLFMIALFVLDGLFGLVGAAETGRNAGGMIVARIAMLLPMLQAFGAIRMLKKQVQPAIPALVYK